MLILLLYTHTHTHIHTSTHPHTHTHTHTYIHTVIAEELDDGLGAKSLLPAINVSVNLIRQRLDTLLSQDEDSQRQVCNLPLYVHLSVPPSIPLYLPLYLPLSLLLSLPLRVVPLNVPLCGTGYAPHLIIVQR